MKFPLGVRNPFYTSVALFNKALKSHWKRDMEKRTVLFCCRLPLQLPQRNSARCCFNESFLASNLLCTKQKYNFWVFPDYFQLANLNFSRSIHLALEKWPKLLIFSFFWVLLLFKRIMRDLWRTARKVDKQIIYTECLKPSSTSTSVKLCWLILLLKALNCMKKWANFHLLFVSFQSFLKNKSSFDRCVRKKTQCC